MAVAFETARAVQSYSRRRKPEASAAHGLIKATLALGAGLAVGCWMMGALATVQGIGGIKPMDYSHQLRASLDLKPIVAAQLSAAERALKISKFSRLGGGAAEKAARLEGAHLAYMNAQVPAEHAVKSGIAAALAKAEADKQFTELASKRPTAEEMKSVLTAALDETVLIAPPTQTAWDATPRGNADEGSVEVADLQSPAELAVAGAMEADSDDGLPMAGPLPIRRPPSNALALALAPANVAKPAVKPAALEEDDEDEAPKALAFAKPENPLKETPARSVPWPDRGTGGLKVAIYDISNGVVHMPSGEKLEAHSGIGEMRDNPKYTHVKMRGPTPPGTYRLSMREKLFHGVAAIRLTPTDGINPLGRTGLLAHSYLLRTRGDSHGCVAFANYDKFLKAFQRGEVTHMIIVDRHNGTIPAAALRKLNLRGGGAAATTVSASGKESDGARRTLADYFKRDG
ncbi:DUF2778 domain-containing protein [Rhizobium helianthi]|uniref:DUF2778 domain-containing protein n=1 Tax=Rhizobium helianthi TaxID=1132695 RepID=A0ABW4M068_9HYPH